jgi:hypothetical protein
MPPYSHRCAKVTVVAVTAGIANPWNDGMGRWPASAPTRRGRTTLVPADCVITTRGAACQLWAARLVATPSGSARSEDRERILAELVTRTFGRVDRRHAPIITIRGLSGWVGYVCLGPQDREIDYRQRPLKGPRSRPRIDSIQRRWLTPFETGPFPGRQWQP